MLLPTTSHSYCYDMESYTAADCQTVILTLSMAAFDVTVVWLIQSDTAAMKCVKPSTVVSHLADCVRAGFPVDIERLGLTDDVEKLIIDVIRKPPINSGIIASCFLSAVLVIC